MNSHLSQDQKSRFILGHASAEEEEHGRNCPQCSVELIQFAKTISTFQGVMKDWSEGEPVPQLEKTPNSTSWRPWAVAGAAVAVLAFIPIYEQLERQSVPQPQTKSDELLMQEVAAHLSRPLPMSMERVMVLLPAPESEEVR